ncbi:isoprenoid synthase domain-containing protein [Infundibulicybe gibba]|nr:isoprenoid synthase domain-containing protein [Infundibulicybe gibba]
MRFIASMPQIHSWFTSHYRRVKDIGKPDPYLYYRIPDTLHNWPWRRHLNPHYSVCKMESAAWFETFKAFSPKAQDAFNRCDFSLLASLAYPLLDKAPANKPILSWMHFTIPTQPGRRANGLAVKQRATRFWENAIKTASLTSQQHFVDYFKSYTDAVVQQAEDRSHNYTRDIKSYFDVRRDTIGLKPSLTICEIHLDLPDYVLADPAIQRLTLACLDMARGDDGHNLVRIVMHERGSTLEEALAWISRLHDDLAGTFLEEYKHVPSKWGSPALDAQVAEYVHGIGNWVRANDSWSFEGTMRGGTGGPRESAYSSGLQDTVSRICGDMRSKNIENSWNKGKWEHAGPVMFSNEGPLDATNSTKARIGECVESSWREIEIIRCTALAAASDLDYNTNKLLADGVGGRINPVVSTIANTILENEARAKFTGWS